PREQFPPVSLPARLPELFMAGPRVVNLGLELFATQLAAHGVPVVQVDWRPPAGGEARLAGLLELLRGWHISHLRRPISYSKGRYVSCISLTNRRRQCAGAAAYLYGPSLPGGRASRS